MKLDMGWLMPSKFLASTSTASPATPAARPHRRSSRGRRTTSRSKMLWLGRPVVAFLHLPELAVVAHQEEVLGAEDRLGESQHRQQLRAPPCHHLLGGVVARSLLLPASPHLLHPQVILHCWGYRPQSGSDSCGPGVGGRAA